MDELTEHIEQEKRRVYVLQISFYEKNSGPVQVLARDEEHAKELLPKLLPPDVKDIVVLDIIDRSAVVPTMPVPILPEDMGPPPGATIN